MSDTEQTEKTERLRIVPMEKITSSAREHRRREVEAERLRGR